MKNAIVEEIKKKAKQMAKSGKKWHFHILTPECQLNKKKSYALVLENTSDEEVLVCYLHKPFMNIGKELVKLLHGKDVVEKDSAEMKEDITPQVARMLKRMKKLNGQGVGWHHHMLFPGCIFNKHKGEWVIVFEDPEMNTVLESVYDNEPKGDLKHIEKLFYEQTKAK